uniref:Jerky protein homolog-like n=1 Tax=Diabrotica virgifera virgifera TaxID=50390 RepID=A0A6P7F7Z7_DIAVI
MELTCDEIKAVFLSPNVTQLVQPMDQDVLQFINLYYTKNLVRNVLEGEKSFITDNPKKINYRQNAIYWVAGAWDNCRDTLIRKLWKKLWSDLLFKEGPFFQATLKYDLLEVVQQLLGCENEDKSAITKWIEADDNGHQEFTDEDVVDLIQPQGNMYEDAESEEEVSLPDRVTYADATKALDVTLRYVEQNTAALPVNVMVMRR